MMTREWLGRGAVLLLVLVGPAAGTQAQPYGGPGMPAYGQDGGNPYSQAVPGPYGYGYPYGYADTYGYDSSNLLPPPAQYFPGPGFRYNANPYATAPNTFSYEMPPNAYAPNTFTYNLRAYADAPPAPAYVPPVYPFGYVEPGYYPGYFYHPQRRFGIYRTLTLGQYIALELHGPTRVRDIVPGIPELGGASYAARR